MTSAALEAQGIPTQQERIALTHVRVVDVATGAIQPDQTILIVGGRIREVGPQRRVKVPADAKVVNATGLYAVPGLWDMHVHVSSTAMRPRAPGEEATLLHNAEFVFPLFVANGVTGIRDMSGNLKVLTDWRRSIVAREMIGPRMIVTGAKVGSDRPVVPGAPYPIATDDDLRKSGRMLKQEGADFVKYLALPPERFPVLMQAARAEGLPVSGHVPSWMRVQDISDAGLASVEHLHGVLLATSTMQEELLVEAQRERTWWGQRLLRAGIWDEKARLESRQRRALESYNDSLAQRLSRRFVKNRTWQTPTLTSIRHVNGVLDDSSLKAARAPYYLPFMTGRRGNWEQGDTLMSLSYARRAFQLTAAMSRAGVPILAGSDMPGTNRLPGFSLLDELEHLVEAGLSPLQALQAATIRPAEFLHARDSLGTIDAGKVADVILVRANPLEDINRMRELEGVVLAGRYLSRRDLDAMLAQVREVARQWRLPPVPHKERP
ncbi:MAG: amidohydrolase family protein [Gemmatimonadetes bacterium]|nr:amidohydrolase family protein [Gemmatimonadota bacterium]